MKKDSNLTILLSRQKKTRRNILNDRNRKHFQQLKTPKERTKT